MKELIEKIRERNRDLLREIAENDAISMMWYDSIIDEMDEHERMLEMLIDRSFLDYQRENN